MQKLLRVGQTDGSIFWYFMFNYNRLRSDKDQWYISCFDVAEPVKGGELIRLGTSATMILELAVGTC